MPPTSDNTPSSFIALASSLARTASGDGGTGVDLFALTGAKQTIGLPPTLRVQCEVTAISGSATPTVTVLIEDSIDGGKTWNTIGTFAAQTTTNRLAIIIGPSGVAQAAGFAWPFNPRKVRARWTISGTNPSLTFSVLAQLI